MSQTIVLTGNTGFIAKHIALAGLNRGLTIRGTLRDSARADEVRKALAPHLSDPSALDRLSFHRADLGSDTGWAEAMAGAEAVLHTASPFPLSMPKDEGDLIRPAVDGTARVMRAAQAAGIGRVVLTSSTVSVLDEGKTGIQDESDWCNTEIPGTTAYAKSKVMAERAAWEIADETGIALTTINPGFVVGPPLDAHYGSSLGLVERLLSGKDPMMPPLGFPVVDVRDIAEMHLRALERPDTAGHRYLGSGGSLTMAEMGRIAKAAYPDRKIPTREAPAFVMRLMAFFDPAIRGIVPKLGRLEQVSTAAAERDLGMSFRPANEALLASCDWLVRNGKA
ncbi:NAD-dependent epimerase/dehydratase family protein [Pararhodobacter aggregans]|uniref:NAD-dependent epimerase/dehydratase family protein n=1 Tax=Pararhodobacter aggregans TaxID=404875 RepID=UPI003A953378